MELLLYSMCVLFFFKQKTAYEMRISDWSSDVCSSDLQDVALMEGTIADNISRFSKVPDARLIISAAKAAGVHEMEVHLRDGYQTELGPHVTALSAGQRQRNELARAIYRDPFLVDLDERTSNLDADGEEAISRTISAVTQRG